MFLSKITLGTVQLGLNYGINNKIGKPSRKVAFEILNEAYKRGITSFDTADVYGESERILGEFLKEKNHDFYITTKLRSLSKSNIKTKDIEKTIFNKIEESINYLNVDFIDNYLLRDFRDIFIYPNLINVLQKAKEQDLIKQVGISLYTPQEAEKIIDLKVFNTIQIPINIFDQRFLRSDILKRLKNNNFLVFVRSVFLQGLFFLEFNNLPVKLYSVRPYLLKLRTISKNNNLSISSIALDFIKKIQEVDSIVIGVETINQLRQNIHEFNKNIKLDLNKNLFKGIEEDIIDPRKW